MSTVLAHTPMSTSRALETSPTAAGNGGNVIAFPSRPLPDPGAVNVSTLSADELELVFYALGLPRTVEDRDVEHVVALVAAEVDRIGADVIAELAADVFGAARAGNPHPRVQLMPSLSGRETAKSWARWLHRTLADQANASPMARWRAAVAA